MTTNRHAYGGHFERCLPEFIQMLFKRFLTEPAILIGILVGVGYALDKDAIKLSPV